MCLNVQVSLQQAVVNICTEAQLSYRLGLTKPKQEGPDSLVGPTSSSPFHNADLRPTSYAELSLLFGKVSNAPSLSSRTESGAQASLFVASLQRQLTAIRSCLQVVCTCPSKPQPGSFSWRVTDSLIHLPLLNRTTLVSRPRIRAPQQINNLFSQY